jgi:hypothetical protein
MNIRIIDYLLIFFIVLVNVLIYTRILIVAAYDQGIKLRNIFIDIGYHHRRLKEIAQQHTSQKKRLIFMIINILIPVSIVSVFAIVLIYVNFFRPHVLSLTLNLGNKELWPFFLNVRYDKLQMKLVNVPDISK